MEQKPRESIAAVAAAIRSGQQSAEALTREHLARIERADPELHAFLSVDAEGAIAASKAVDAKISSSEPVGSLAGVPISIKDVLCTKGWPTTAGSRALDGWRPPYDATVVSRLAAAGAVILGKTNCDEFAMGSSTEHSGFGPTKNPIDASRVPGGSSGGSAAAVASGMSMASVGTDTGGSVRQPAAFCGVVGLKPTYGRVSRYGLIAMASSLDTVGFFGTSVADVAVLLEASSGHDGRDSTSVAAPVPTASQAAEQCDLASVKIGVPAGCLGEGVDPVVRAAFESKLEKIRAAGAKVVDLPLPSLDYALAVYYILMPAEVSANMARFDGVRYPSAPSGRSGQAQRSFSEMVKSWRSQHLGPEVQRRILTGAYVLSAGYSDAFYRRAQAARQGIRAEFAASFEQVDAIATPTAPVQAFGLGEKLNDPLSMYLADLYTVPANIAGVPAISLPIATTGLPVGLQLAGAWWEEAKLLSLAQAIEGV